MPKKTYHTIQLRPMENSIFQKSDFIHERICLGAVENREGHSENMQIFIGKDCQILAVARSLKIDKGVNLFRKIAGS